MYLGLNEKIVLLPEDNIEFFYWDEEKSLWSQENILETTEIEENQRKYYSISVPKMAPITIMTSYACEFPYKFFKIRRVGRHSILF